MIVMYVQMVFLDVILFGNWNSQTQPSYHITLMIDVVRVDKLETSKRSSSLTGDKGCVGTEKEKSSFDSMNNIVANLLLNMTSSARFEGRYHNNFSISGDQSLEKLHQVGLLFLISHDLTVNKVM